MVLVGPHGLRDERMAAVRADHDLGPFAHGLTALRAALDADDASVFDEELLHREALSNFRAGLSRGVDQQFVQHGPPRAVRDRRVCRARRAGDRERTEIERVGVDRRTSGRGQPIEQSPSRERGDAQRVHDMRRHRVARECRAVDHEHAVSLPGQQHRRWRTRAARAHDDRVVRRIHVISPHVPDVIRIKPPIDAIGPSPPSRATDALHLSPSSRAGYLHSSLGLLLNPHCDVRVPLQVSDMPTRNSKICGIPPHHRLEPGRP